MEFDYITLDDDYFNLVEVVPAGPDWDIVMHTKKGLQYTVDQRTNKNNAKHVAIGICLAVGAGNRQRKQPLELIVKNRRGFWKGKDSKSSFGYDPKGNG